MIPKRIVAIGASVCEGGVDPEGGGFVGRLRKWREGEDQHNHVYNLGISGETSKQILKRLLVESRPRRPDLVIFQSGLNDSKRVGSRSAEADVPIDQFKKNIEKIIVQARSIADLFFISVYPIDGSKTTPVSWENSYYLFDDVKVYMQITRKICKEKMVPYVDIFNKWLKEDYKKYLHDGLHANSRGHKVIFKEIKRKLTEIYK